MRLERRERSAEHGGCDEEKGWVGDNPKDWSRVAFAREGNSVSL